MVQHLPLCCSAILLSLPRATARLTDRLVFIDEKKYQGKKKKARNRICGADKEKAQVLWRKKCACGAGEPKKQPVSEKFF